MASRLDLFQQFLEWEASDTTTEGTTEGSELTDGHEVDSDSGSPSGNECTSGAEQYLTKRAPGKKATLASKKFRYTLKEACKDVKLWGSGNGLKKATPGQKKYIHDKIFAEFPAMRGHSMEINLTLTRMLANKNYYEKKKKDKNNPKSKPTSKPGPNKDSAHGSGHVKEKKQLPQNTFSKSTSSKGAASVSADYCEGDNVIITHGAENIATAVFKEKSEFGMYCLVEFEEHLYDDPLNELGDLEFPEPLEDGKASFGELQGGDIFKWKLEKIKLNTPKGGYVVGKLKAKRGEVQGKRTRTRKKPFNE